MPQVEYAIVSSTDETVVVNVVTGLLKGTNGWELSGVLSVVPVGDRLQYTQALVRNEFMD
jgi:hypothetical protein